MCGRATLVSGLKEVSRFSGLVPGEEFSTGWNDHFPNYNLAPTHFLPAIIDRQEPVLCLLKWGLIPSWAKDEKMAYRMINARAETIMEKPAYRQAFRKRRCLAILDGYYEWQGSQKVPWRITKSDEKPFAIAGIWESKLISTGVQLNTVSLITRPAIKQLEHIHDRMPFTIHPDAFDSWLQTDFKEKNEWQNFTEDALFPLDKCYRVSRLVNSVKNNSPGCIKVNESEDRQALF